MAEKINDGGPAFPASYYTDDGEFAKRDGMSLRQYAAIHLRVPNSGTDWLDAMIVEAKRDELAAKAMQAYFTDPNARFGSDVVEAGSQAAYRIADAMLKARGQQ